MKRLNNRLNVFLQNNPLMEPILWLTIVGFLGMHLGAFIARTSFVEDVDEMSAELLPDGRVKTTFVFYDEIPTDKGGDK